MSTEIKFVLSVVLICAIIVAISVVGISYRCEIPIYEQVEETRETEPTKELEIEVTETTTQETTIEETTTKQVEPTKNLKDEKVETTKIDKINGYTNYDVPSNNTIKSYMDYRCITSKSSKQYKLQNSIAYTGDNGIRMVNGRYCVAVGSYYTTTIGQYIDIELANGKVIKGILADCKDDRHTDSTNRINPNGSVVEFVVDTKTLDSMAKKMGDISYVNGWNSKVVNIKVYDKIENF